MPNVNSSNIAKAPETRCAECMKQVSSADAYDPEGLEYDITFCGVECYEAWNRKSTANDTADRPLAPHRPKA